MAVLRASVRVGARIGAAEAGVQRARPCRRARLYGERVYLRKLGAMVFSAPCVTKCY
jgi:hypothetical protein